MSLALAGLRQAEETAREELDEVAMTLGCRILALEQRQPRALLLQALKQHAAKVLGLYYTALDCAALHCIAPHCTAPRCGTAAVLHCAALRYSACTNHRSGMTARLAVLVWSLHC